VTSRRPEGFDLARAVLDRGFTPRRADAAALLGLLGAGDEAVTRGAERALLSLGAATVPGVAALACARDAAPAARVAAVRTLGAAAVAGLLRDEETARAAAQAVLAVLEERSCAPRLRRAAVRAAARLAGRVQCAPGAGAQVAAALMARAHAPDADESEAGALLEALGTLGGARASEPALGRELSGGSGVAGDGVAWDCGAAGDGAAGDGAAGDGAAGDGAGDDRADPSSAAALRQAIAALEARVTTALGRQRAALARARLARDALRSTSTSALRYDVPAPAPLRVALACDAGLEDVLAAEARALGCDPVRIAGPGRVHCTWPAGATLARATAHACAREVAFVVGPAELVRDDGAGTAGAGFRGVGLLGTGRDATGHAGMRHVETRHAAEDRGGSRKEVTAAVLSLIDAAARDDGPLRAGWTAGPRRFRLSWAAGGHRRADTREVSLALAARAADLVDDPRGSPWEVRVVEEPAAVDDGAGRHAGGSGARVWLHVVPRALVREAAGALDAAPRARRAAEPAADDGASVQGASHAAVAAALARLAAPGADDVVWDPFCGGGSELLACAELGVRALVGTDVDARAVAIARARLSANGVEADLTVADALGFVPRLRPTVIVTNPPLGRRVGRRAGASPEGHPAALLERFAAHAARVLAPGGRLVWLSPHGDRTAAALGAAGFRVVDRRRVDLGGIAVERQVASLGASTARAGGRPPSAGGLVPPGRGQRGERRGGASGLRATKR
jgi:SAM-dependent methyltransferase